MDATQPLATILLVEDDTDVRTTIALWLTTAGYAVIEAADGLEGLARVRQDAPDAILLDLRLPRLDGFEVLAALADEPGDTPPVIVISAQDAIDGVVRAFRMGAGDYIQKPIVSLDLLGHSLRAALERRRLARAVTAAESRYFNLVQNLPLVVFVLDAALELDFINKSCHDMLGFSRDEALAEPGWFLARLHEEDRDRVAACLLQALPADTPARTEECRFIHKNGATVHALLRAMPSAKDRPCDAPAMVEGIVIDITDRVELERFVVQEEKLKTLGAISAEVAHEIRNPLFSIAGFAHRLQARMPENREAGIILTEARRLEGILDRISTYLHPVDLRPRLCSLSAITGAVLDFLAPEFARFGVAATSVPARDMPELRLDPDLLTQVVTSLARFAARHLPRGGDLRLVASRHARFAHLDVVFRPEHGILEPELLFLPFEEGEERMGLPLAYRIVKNMGGALSFTQQGGEAIFTVQLPLELPAATPNPGPAART